jgi:hypothetical protein
LAKSAVPKLIGAAKEGDGELKAWALEALSKIDPEAATKAGTK